MKSAKKIIFQKIHALHPIKVNNNVQNSYVHN